MEQDRSKLPWIGEPTPENKMTLTSTANLREIIVYGKNWGQFESIFYKDSECMTVQFRFFEALRNKIKHPNRKLEEIEKGLGYWGMKWIRRSMGLDVPKEA